ncbi:hypothetical protein EYZ11_005581 [Aspergillus tanneri]|uniref:Rhodopsin domain-containing protein n=1 Tax=Aspergillus tanneri TaxID=1220188 RepID=A0A4S3JHW4_9EURO|nr:hypothetical protein EYZ11_005581 [Aspergillus tanneri]
MASSTPPPDDVSRATVVTIPTIITTVIALVLTLLRLYVRRYMIRMVDWDDLFNVLGLLTVLVVMGLVITATSYGLGRHFEYVDKQRAAFSVKLLRIAEFHLIFSTIFVKISISLFLKRLLWKVFFWCFIAFNSITSALDAAVIFPQCTPVEFNWDKSIEGGHCWSNEAIDAVGIAQGTIAAATDFVLSLLPILFLWNVKLPKRVKLGICGIMALGFASGGFAIARTVLVPDLTTTTDPTWDLVDLFMWAVLEATFGVIAAAAPSVRPLIGHNSMTTESYSRSKSLQLRSMHTGKHSRREWGQTILETVDEPADRISNDGDSQSHLWGQEDRGIIKTMSIEVVTTHRRTESENQEGLSERSSHERRTEP